MNFLRALCFSCLTLLAACGREPATSPVPVAEVQEFSLQDSRASMDIDRIMADITELSSDVYEGRAPMSAGETLTLDYIEQQFRSTGLHPLFGASYFQAVNLVSIEAEAASAQMTLHIKDQDRPVSNGDEMVIGTRRVAPESRVENSEVVFVGFGVVAPEYGWDDYAGVDVKGKTVLILINDPGFATQDPALFKGQAMTYYGRWTYKYEEAARQGAAAALIIHDTAPAAYGWDVVRNSWSGPQFHLARPDDNMNRVAIEAWIQKPVAQELAQAAGYEFSELERQALEPTFKAVSLGSTMDASIQNQIIRNKSYNIGAMLPGSKHPEEIFIYTAHWDHLGTDQTAATDVDGIYNGAVDNASGIAALLELGRAFASLPRAAARSIAFVAVTAEESGLLGSAHYAENPAFPMNQTVGGINMDSVQVYGPSRDLFVVGYGSSELEDVLQDQAAGHGRVVKPEDHPERGYYYRSDHFNLAKKGVPMLYTQPGTEHTERGADYIPAKKEEYLKTRYHSPLDEIDDDWDLRGLVQDLELWFAVGLDVADGDQWPNWYQGNEFRAIRNESRSAAQP